MQTSPFECDCDEPIELDYNRLSKLLLGSHVLAKACSDPFDYALKLRTGEVIRFAEARIISPGWINLDVVPAHWDQAGNNLPYSAGRGVDVRIADIVWVMDAPEGS